MRVTRSLKVAAMLGAVLALAAGCKKKPPTTTPQAVPPPSSSTEAPPSTTTAPPPPPSRGDAGVLSEDLQTLNSKGYLKDAFFDFDKADLREDARTALAADAQWLKQYGSIRVLIEGHADERGTEEYNLSLGQKRASSVKDYLVSLGVEGSRVNTVSYGKARPFCADHDDNCWQQNRRGHFVITGK
jgi:peptidoglycan-associated lipoprotein